MEVQLLRSVVVDTPCVLAGHEGVSRSVGLCVCDRDAKPVVRENVLVIVRG